MGERGKINLFEDFVEDFKKIWKIMISVKNFVLGI
jgi:hypothetical protein